VIFTRLTQGEALTISNPQAVAVSGTVRALPAPSAAASQGTAFTIPAGQSIRIANVLATTGSALPAAIVAVEASDAVTVSTHALPLAYAGSPQDATVIHTPASDRTGTLVLGLMGDVDVSIYASRDSTTPLVTRRYGAFGGEQTVRLAFSQLLGATPVSVGVARISPISGGAVVTSELPPMRTRAVHHPGSPRAAVSVTGASCALQSGLQLTTPATGDEYRWQLAGASAASTTASTLDAIPGTAGYATFSLRKRTGASYEFASVFVKVADKPSVTSLRAFDAVEGQDILIRWTVTSSGTGLLTGTDFPPQGTAVDLAAGQYAYTAASTGAKSVRLDAENACGAGSMSESYAVLERCTVPTAVVTAPTSVAPGASFTASMPDGASSYSWEVANGTITAGQGTRTLTATAGTSGSVSISGTASNGAGCAANGSTSVAIVIPAPTITAFSVTPASIGRFGFGPGSCSQQCATTNVSFTAQNTTSWSATTASKENGWTADPLWTSYSAGQSQQFLDPETGGGSPVWSGNGSGTFSRALIGFLPCSDAVIVTAMGPGGTSRVALPLRVDGCILAFHGSTTGGLVVPVGSTVTLTLSYIGADASTLTATSSLGSTLAPQSQAVPENYGVYSFTYTRMVAGDDSVVITSAACGGTRTILVK